MPTQHTQQINPLPDPNGGFHNSTEGRLDENPQGRRPNDGAMKIAKILVAVLAIVVLILIAVFVGNGRGGAAAVGDNTDAKVEKSTIIDDGGVDGKSTEQQPAVIVDLAPVVAAITAGNDKLSAKLDQMAAAQVQPAAAHPNAGSAPTPASVGSDATSSAPAPPATEPCPPEKPPVTLETLDQRVEGLEKWKVGVDARLARHTRQINKINNRITVLIQGAKPAEMPGLVKKTPDYTVQVETVVKRGPRPTPAPPRVTRP